ncbi:hypothetical protein ACFP2T_11490 [Plantactinospora solaniradicis]|uniref:Alpha/beta hydrolase n=1 Tax=Plantactinospora solaniradicis TaxID=1723736 RepID=A0ABW1K6M9_9ACTN
MTTALFVHGTGVRKPHFDGLFDRVRAGLATAAPRLRVAPCYWGEPFGSRLHADGRTIPSGTGYRDLPDDRPIDLTDDDETAVWALLDHDPLFELRLLALRSPADLADLPPNALPPGDRLAETLRTTVHDDELVTLLTAAGIAVDFRTAIETVVDSAPYDEATAGSDDPELRRAVVRAVVAQAQSQADARLGGPLPLAGELRDRIVARGSALLGTERALGAALARTGARLALALGATRPVERRRAAITEAASPAAGDVLLYLARGAQIRNAIRRAVDGLDGPVVLVAHSLGGIACVDLLATEAMPEVTLLVTVGSQAPLLYELDALPSLSYGQPLPANFPAWLNVYDRRDMLAFLAQPVFSAAVDHELDNRVPFPRSHSAYFGNPAFYARVGRELM